MYEEFWEMSVRRGMEGKERGVKYVLLLETVLLLCLHFNKNIFRFFFVYLPKRYPKSSELERRKSYFLHFNRFSSQVSS